jgi:hypothetical protein
MTRVRIGWIIGITAVLSIAALGRQQLPREWKNSQTLQVEQTGLVQVAVPAESLDAARPGLEDLRLFDAGGREVPYLLERPVPERGAEAAAADFESALRSDSTLATFRNSTKSPVNAVILDTPAREFLKSVQLEASRDGTKWQRIATDVPLFRQVNGDADLEIRFPSADWGYFRLTLDDRRSLAIPLTGARLRTAPIESQVLLPVAVKVTNREEQDGYTHLTLLAAGANVVIGRMEIDTPESLFSRRIELYARQLVEGEIREVLFARGSVTRIASDASPVELRIDHPQTVLLPAREFVLCIKNADSPPLQIRSIKVWRYPVYLTWESSASNSFTMLSGNPRCAPPRYDLSALGERLKPRTVTPRLISPLVPNPAYRAADLAPEFPEIAGVIDSSAWAYHKRVKPGPAGMQELELDPEVLSHAGATLHDIRLVRAGKQVPYLVEKSRLRRFLSPIVSVDSAIQEGRQSRWILGMPYKNLPIDTLTLNTDSPFFRRPVTLRENRPGGSRREPYPIATATWMRSPGMAKERLEMGLRQMPVSENLVLEIENGDNPPLELRDIKVSYPVTRLVFRYTGTDEIAIHYGNHRSPAPRYDIEYVARDILAVERSAAAMEGEQAGGGGLFGGSSVDSQWPGWIYWGVLGLVVVVLFAVIRHLLPKTPET